LSDGKWAILAKEPACRGGDGGRVQKIKKGSIPLVIRTAVKIYYFLQNINHSISKFACY